MPGPGQPEARGDLENTLTSIHPYLRYAVTDRLAVWGLLGYGWGELELAQGTGDTLETDTTLVMGAVGGRGILLAAADSGGLPTRHAHGRHAHADEFGRGDGDGNPPTRTRTGCGWCWKAPGPSRGPTAGRLTPTVELGVRHDWGDAETGFGVEVGGRIRYTDPTLGLTIEGTVRGLLAHEDAAYEEWGASGNIRLAPGPGGQGLALTLAPTWGAAASGVDGLWTRQTTAGLAPTTSRAQTGQLSAEVGLWCARALRHRTPDPLCGHGAGGGRGPHLAAGYPPATKRRPRHGPDAEPGRHAAEPGRPTAGQPGPAAPGHVGLLRGLMYITLTGI